MKTFFRILIYTLFAAAIVACDKKEVAPESEPDVFPPEEPVEGEFEYVFKIASEETKTIFGDNHIAWEDGDLIASYAKTSKNKYTEVEVDGSNVTMTIRSTVALSAGDMVYAYAPFNAVNNEADANAVTLEIPRNQVSGSAAAMPLVTIPFELTSAVESYTDTEVGTLQFLNLGFIVKLNIYKSSGYSAGEKIENVTFQAGAACAGSFTYDLTAVDADNMPVISGYTETDVVVSGDGSSPITVGADKDHGGVVYMVVAPGTYGGTFVIRTSAGDYTYVSGTNRTFSRASLKPLNIDNSTSSLPGLHPATLRAILSAQTSI